MLHLKGCEKNELYLVMMSLIYNNPDTVNGSSHINKCT